MYFSIADRNVVSNVSAKRKIQKRRRRGKKRGLRMIGNLANNIIVGTSQASQYISTV